MKVVSLLLTTYFWCNASFGDHAVTYQPLTTRFGDQVLNYLHAKWVAYYYHIPLFYRPFPYSSELMMHESEPFLSRMKDFYHEMNLTDFSQPKLISESTLFSTPYFPETEYELMDWEFHFSVDWKNEEFRKIVLEMLVPKNHLQLIYPPRDQVSIAMHIREGGGFDSRLLPVNFPIKSPPLQFYIDSLITVTKHLPKTPIYCYIFSDAKKPKKMVDLIERMMPSDALITFDYRKEENGPDFNVLEDFFSLFNFDILIRPGSNYSIVPSLLHDYAILCYPISFSIANNIVTIEETKIEINQKLYDQCLKKGAKAIH